jgi:hypothetical protein
MSKLSTFLLTIKISSGSRITHNGESLYTVRDNPETLRERLAALRDFIASPVTYRK